MYAYTDFLICIIKTINIVYFVVQRCTHYLFKEKICLVQSSFLIAVLIPLLIYHFYSAKSSDIIKARRQSLPVGVPLPAALLDNKKVNAYTGLQRCGNFSQYPTLAPPRAPLTKIKQPSKDTTTVILNST